jgi:3-deoxy-manno-octulosonate cytidylyltransferase (CMP-KDO synthetase)
VRVTAIIPARYASTRFPGKPLFPLAGKPMILHVAERVAAAVAAGVVDRFLVATDDERIRDAVAGAGFEVRMTSSEHATGTDRLAEVARDLSDDVVCNVQGDEPLIEAETIEALVRPLREDPALVMGTLKTALDRPEDRFDPNRGKVVVDERERALTFTRLPIIEARRGLVVYSDIGVYAYRREFLLEYGKLARTPFEQSERLEQLRALEHGYEIAVPTVAHRALEVDTPEDVARVEAALAAERG